MCHATVLAPQRNWHWHLCSRLCLNYRVCNAVMTRNRQKIRNRTLHGEHKSTFERLHISPYPETVTKWMAWLSGTVSMRPNKRRPWYKYAFAMVKETKHFIQFQGKNIHIIATVHILQLQEKKKTKSGQWFLSYFLRHFHEKNSRKTFRETITLHHSLRNCIVLNPYQ